MPMPTILFYSPTPQPYASKLLQLCAIQAVKLRMVEGAELDRPLSILAQGPRPTESLAPEGELSEPVLVFCHFSDPQLDRALQSLRRIRVLSLKAVLTPSNAGWTLRELYRELCRERSQLGNSHPPRP